MGKWYQHFEPDGELTVSALKREFGAGAFPRRRPVRSTAFKCKICHQRFPVPGKRTVAGKQANAWWRKKHPLCARGENPVCSACARRGACASTPPHRPHGGPRPSRCVCQRAHHELNGLL